MRSRGRRSCGALVAVAITGATEAHCEELSMRPMRAIIARHHTVFILVAMLLLLVAGCGGGGGGSDLNTVQPQNDAVDDVAPVLVKNTGSEVGEGSVHTILATELSYHDSAQPPLSVRFMVTLPPRGGQLEMLAEPGSRISQFTQADIDAGSVVYKNARGNVTSDVFGFAVDDGQGNTLVGQTFNLDVIPNVRSFDLRFDNGLVNFSWVVPLSGRPAGVEIRRSDTGRYPASPGEGVLIHDAQQGERQAADTVSYDPSNGPASYYYTAFSVSDNGTYSDGTKVGLYCDVDGCVTVPELRELNSIQSSSDAETRRRLLTNVIWDVDTLPGWLPATVAAISDQRYTNAQDIKQIVVGMDYGLTSTLWFLTPFSANGKLVIYHEGHRSAFHLGIDVIQRFLQEGFHVLAVSMPLVGGPNSQSAGSFTSHDDFAGLDRPMRFFLEPVAVGLNYVTSEKVFDKIYMTGISGGGWTTVLYSALDTRISASYPVAGSYPFYLKEQLGGSTLGDFEQTSPNLYQHVSYLELYLMGAADRRQLQIYNVFDNCCFGATYSNTFKDFIQNTAAEMGGSLDVVLDDTVVGHEISEFAVETILGDMAAN